MTITCTVRRTSVCPVVKRVTTPACYRRNFPVQWKSHRSHDIVLLCVDCHHVAHKAAEAVKRQLSQEYGVPLSRQKSNQRLLVGKCQKRTHTM